MFAAEVAPPAKAPPRPPTSSPPTFPEAMPGRYSTGYACIATLWVLSTPSFEKCTVLTSASERMPVTRRCGRFFQDLPRADVQSKGASGL
jgi:hypothetical protein